MGAAPGRIRYRDLNGDGRIDALDQEFFGTTLPALEYGTRIDLGYTPAERQLMTEMERESLTLDPVNAPYLQEPVTADVAGVS